ncbi:MAG: gamma-glutamyl-gamma-aminobutyrate hydrolase family protein [Actinobacteria bacterium]|nr:gamma-glutamyl-gamma-aminobutyrate hydrolase family protein [Actinomycetota bacterium]
MAVELVFTERRSELTESRAKNYARLHERVAAASGQVVGEKHYEDVDAERLAAASSIVLSGSSAPWSVRDPAELDRLGEAVLAAGRPVLGICAGMQLQVRFAGGTIAPSSSPEHGFLQVRAHDRSDLLRGLPAEVGVFQDHDDEIVDLPAGFRVLASSPACAIQAIGDPARRWWGTQFHPEESSAEHPAGERVLANFFELSGFR